jgi:Ca2+-binding EF-hand superfamily protein
MDGLWTKEEFVKRPAYMKRNDPTRLREKFKRWDKDENGVWSLKEAEMAINGNFKWLDKDKNKTISMKEMPADF